jgi:transposase, IS30 family
MSQYKRLTQEKRQDIALMLIFKPYQYRIAEQIGCTQSAISQELSRNLSKDGYDALKAQNLADSRRRSYDKPVLDDLKIQNFIEEELKKRRSPMQISKLAERKGFKVSKSSIYNYLDFKPELKKYRKHKKYWKHNHQLSSKHGIRDRVSITERPEKANTREEFGHLEIDFVIGSGSKDCILSGRERKTRFPFFIKLENKTEILTTEAIKNNLILDWVKSFSTDNDKSFVGHSVIKSMTGIPTYFTRPSAPYEKGAIEQLNKELRVFYPKGTDFKDVSQDDLDEITNNLRTVPMEVLNWKTPQEALEAELVFNTS